jgi:hypothetical protein
VSQRYGKKREGGPIGGWEEKRRGPYRRLGRRDGVVRQGWHGSVVGLGKIGFWGREVAGPDWLRGGREL